MYSVGSSLKNWEFLVPQESMDTWAKILDDPNPIHLDVNSVKSLGRISVSNYLDEQKFKTRARSP